MTSVLLHEILKQRAVVSPDEPALIFLGKKLTYAELDSQSDKLAAFLQRSGTAIGDRVGIFLNKSLETMVSLFGILKAGAAYVPIDPQLPPARARYIVETCMIRTVITSSQNFVKLISEGPDDLFKDLNVILADGRDMPRKIGEPACRITALAEIVRTGLRTAVPVSMADANPAYILFTSGSTGVPKGVVISHLNAMTFINMAAGYFDVRKTDRFAGHAPIHFDLSVFDIYVSMMQGAVLILVPEYLSAFPIRLADFINENRISVWNSSASVLAMLADKGKIERFNYTDMRLVHFSGDVLPIKFLRKLRASMPDAQFYNIYGQTEANSSLSYHVVAAPENDSSILPIGKPFPNFEVFILGEDNQVISEPGKEGELCVKASTVALGYWQNSATTNEKFVLDPRCEGSHVRIYRTGDIVRKGEDGDYFFVGRKDHMVKSRGYRIELPEIEQAICNHPLVSTAAAIAIPDMLIGNKIIAYVSVKEGVSIESADLIEFCQIRLPKYMIPEIFEFRASLPMTSSGKIDRKGLANEAISKYCQ